MKLLYFYAPWCTVCQTKSPEADRIAAEAGLELERWDTDTDAGRAEGERYRIRGIPTLALVDGDRVPFRLVGRMITPEYVRQLLDRYRAA
ncbi:MAG TPA: thioredoxin domain-containing protein [Gemmatimonadales bacterium]|nr:thioredoxin domain-containing protein [Gemmatimonadales bacterium]